MGYVTFQAVLFSATVLSGTKCSSRVSRAAKRQLRSLWRWKPDLVPQYIVRLLAVEEDLPSLCLLTELADYCYQTSELDPSQQVRDGESVCTCTLCVYSCICIRLSVSVLPGGHAELLQEGCTGEPYKALSVHSGE